MTVVRRIMAQAWSEMDAMNREKSIEALKTLQKQGIQFIDPQPEIKAAWYELAASVNRQIVEAGYITPAMVEMLDAYLKDYRSRQARKND